MNDRYAVLECDLLQGVSYRLAQELSVRRFTFKDDAKSNDGVGGSLLCDLVHDERNFEGARNTTQTNPGAG